MVKIHPGTVSILRYMRSEFWSGIIFFALGIVILLLNLYEPFIAQDIMNAAFSTEANTPLLTLTGLWIVIFVCKNILMLCHDRYALQCMLRMMERIQMDFFHKLLHAPLTYFQQFSKGYILSRHVNDFFNLEGMMLNHLVDGMLGILQALIILFFLFQIHISLGLLAVFLKSLDLAINYGFPLKQLYKNHNEAASQMERNLEDVIHGISLIKSGAQEDQEAYFYRDRFLTPFYDTWSKRDKANIWRRVIGGMSLDASYIIMIAAGSLYISEGLLSAGNIMAALLFYQKLGSALSQFIPVIPLFKIGQASAERLYELQVQMGQEIEERPEPHKAFTIKHTVQFQHVSLTRQDKSILHDINLAIHAGEVVALVGRSGAGKSTMASLLLRFLEPSSGRILIDGTDIQKCPLSELRKQISYLPQEPILLQRTLMENLEYHISPNQPAPELLRFVLERSYANELLRKWEAAGDATADAISSSLSGGEKQRLCLAREMLKDGFLYIFDEATSALDPLSDKVIRQTIQDLAKKDHKAVLVIAHRLSSITYADHIYVLDHGQLAESGTHTELMSKKGLYYDMYIAQKSDTHHAV